VRQALQSYDLEARYRDLALKACDIVDLANLPEDDRHLATRELELRRLYVALRLGVCPTCCGDPGYNRSEFLQARHPA
jgi:hypothetical protein